MEGLGEEALDFPGAEDGHLVLIVELVHAENRDDVLEILVALEDELHATGDAVMLGSDDFRRERFGSRSKRVNGGEESLLSERALKNHGGIKVSEGVRGSGVSKVVRRNVNGLDGGDGALIGGGDALLKNGHFLGKGRLVTHGGGCPAKKGGNLGTGLGEAEDVIDEEENVLAFLVAEVFRHGECGKSDAETGTRRLVHLAVAKSHLRAFCGENWVTIAVEFRMSFIVLFGGDNAGLDHFPVEVVSFTSPLTHTGEDGEATVRFRDIVDEFHDDDGLADAGATEHAAFSTLEQRANEVDDLDTSHENFRRGRLIGERWGGAMDWGAVVEVCERDVFIHEIASDVEDTSENLFADRNGDGLAGICQGHPAFEAVGGGHGDGAHPAITKVLLHFEHEFSLHLVENVVDLEGVIDFRKL